MQTTQPKIGLFIDAENISPYKLNYILNTLTNLGCLEVKQAFGNWDRPELDLWRQSCENKNIEIIHQLDCVKGKNYADISLSIGVMDCLYNVSIDAFAIASSDSDFLALAERLKCAGKHVFGFGDRKTNKHYQQVFSRFFTMPPNNTEQPRNRKTPGDHQMMRAHLISPGHNLVYFNHVLNSTIRTLKRQQKPLDVDVIRHLIETKTRIHVDQLSRCHWRKVVDECIHALK